MSGTSRPFKVWSADRINRKSVTASTLEDLKVKGTSHGTLYLCI